MEKGIVIKLTEAEAEKYKRDCIVFEKALDQYSRLLHKLNNKGSDWEIVKFVLQDNIERAENLRKLFEADQSTSSKQEN